MLSNSDLVELTAFRRALHRKPEVSGDEKETARAIRDFILPTGPDLLLTDLGGHGLAAVFQGAETGPTVMIRSELDALPIIEQPRHDHGSSFPGKGHLCGHDGHSTILAAVARCLGRRRPRAGRVVLLFQPAEENGAGAAAVLADPAFGAVRPDWAFSLHNMPGLPLGHVALQSGPANCASRGMKVALTGKEAHASMPETGLSPALAISGLIPALMALGPGGSLDADFRLVTITHVTLGEAAFGIAPGRAEVWATLRTLSDGPMTEMVAAAETVARQTAVQHHLDLTISYHDGFAACANHPLATGHLEAAIAAEGIARSPFPLPMRASEDFGLFGSVAPSAMFLLGAGVDAPALHNPDYDFPDDLIAVGTRVFLRVVRDLLG
jgi:amidohydrolase